MSNNRETINYFLKTIGNSTHISTRMEPGECIILADGKAVALIADDLLYVPVCEASRGLASLCETDVPYLGAKSHYVIDEGQVAGIHTLSKILLSIGRSLA